MENLCAQSLTFFVRSIGYNNDVKAGRSSTAKTAISDIAEIIFAQIDSEKANESAKTLLSTRFPSSKTLLLKCRHERLMKSSRYLETSLFHC